MAKNKNRKPQAEKAVSAEPRPEKEAKKMTERELLSIVDANLNQSLGRSGSTLSNDRLKALKYYFGDKEGNLAPPEAEGRSSVVSMDVSDTIEWILPSLIRIFTSGEKAVEYGAKKEADVALAEQATEWGNHVFYVQNEGFIILHDWMKDALLQKLGIVKTWWDESEDITTEEYDNMTLEQLALMLQDGTVEIIQKTEKQAQSPAGPIQVFDVKVKRTIDSSHICIENVPPEEFLFSRKARTPQRMFSCGHRIMRSVTELKEAGYENTDKLMDDDCGAEFSQEAVERESDTNDHAYGSEIDESADETMRMVWITECYLQVDWNGDGLAEWRKVVKSGKVLLDNEEVEEHPFSMLTPIKMPHQLVGRSVADLLLDIQDIKTSLVRQFIDNAYLTNNARTYVDENAKVNIDDLLDNRVGGIVRGKGPNGIQPIVTQPLSPTSFSLLEYLDQVKEGRTGVNKTFQGLNANTLSDTTATATNAMLGAAQEKVELIARIFAETGVKDLFKKIIKLSAMYQKQEQVVRLTGKKFVTIDPRSWKTQYDIMINVGLGNGNKDQTAAHIMNIMAIQEKAAAAGLPIVSPKEIYNAAAKLVINSGFKSADPFFIDPETDKGLQISQAASEKPDPEMLKLQSDQAAKKAELDMKQKEIQMENERQRQNDERDFAREEAKADREEKIRMYEIDMEHKFAMEELKYKSDLEMKKHTMTTEAAAKPMLQFDTQGAMDGAAASMTEAALSLQELAVSHAHTQQIAAGDQANALAQVVQSLSNVVDDMKAVNSGPKIVKMKTSAGKELVGEIIPKK